MGLDPPTGCTFASLKSSSIVKLESLQLRLSNVKSTLSSERKALRRERVNPVMTVNGSLLHQSMAYIIVGTRRYLKEVPELIKVGFNAWRSSSSSYEVVQGMFFWQNSVSDWIQCIYVYCFSPQITPFLIVSGLITAHMSCSSSFNQTFISYKEIKI